MIDIRVQLIKRQREKNQIENSMAKRISQQEQWNHNFFLLSAKHN